MTTTTWVIYFCVPTGIISLTDRFLSSTTSRTVDNCLLKRRRWGGGRRVVFGGCCVYLTYIDTAVCVELFSPVVVAYNYSQSSGAV